MTCARVSPSANGQEVLEPFRDSSLCDPQPAAGDAKNRSRDRPALCFRVERRERLLCSVELALIDERLDEHTGVQDAVQVGAGSSAAASAVRASPSAAIRSPRRSASQPR